MQIAMGNGNIKLSIEPNFCSFSDIGDYLAKTAADRNLVDQINTFENIRIDLRKSSITYDSDYASKLSKMQMLRLTSQIVENT